MFLAMYLPRPEHLTESVGLLFVVWLTLCWCACRLKLRLWIAAPLMLVSGVLAIVPDIPGWWSVQPSSYPELIREYWPTETDGWRIALTGYMHAGRGSWMCVVGMLCGLGIHALTVKLVGVLWPKYSEV